MSDPFNSDVKAESLSPAAFLKKRLLESRTPEKAAEIAAKTDGFQGIRNREMIDLLKSQAGAAELRDAANERLRRTGQSDLEAAQNELDSGRRAAMEGANRVAFDIAAFPFTSAGRVFADQVDPKTWDILQRQANGEQLTVEDETLLNTRPTNLSPFSGTPQQQTMTNLELAQKAGWASEQASKIQEYSENTSWGNKLNTRLRDRFTADIGEAYTEGGSQASFQAAEKAADEGDWMSAVTQSATGIAQLVRDGGKAVIDNPQAAFEFISENLPQLAVGAVSKTALTGINVAYGADIYRDGIDTYKAENNGAMPPKAQMDKMLAFSIAAAAAENVADMSLLKGLSKIPGADKATKEAMDSVVGKIVNNKFTNNAATRIAGTAAKNVGTEAVTEVTQTYLEEATKGKEASGEELAQAAVIGGASGGGIGATTKSIGELRTAGAEALKRSEDYQVDKRADSEQIEAAVIAGRETGDVSPLLDPENPETYAPESAAITLWQRSLDPELDPQERADASAQYKEIVREQEARVKFAEESYSQVNPEIIAQYEQQLEDPDLDPELRPLLEQTVNEAKAEGRKGAKERLDKLKVEQTRLAQLNELRNIDSQVQSEPVIAENLDSAKEGVKPAINSVIDAMVINPDAVSDEDIETIGESAAPEQKKFLARTQQFLRAFTEADAAANAARGTQGVQNDVINGRVGFKGIKEYVRNVGAALASNKRDEADTEYNQLKLFSSEHKIKQEKMAEAISLTEETGKPHFLVKDYSADGGWEVTSSKPPKWNRKRNGGFEVRPKSLGGARKVYASIEAENAAINAGLAQIEASIELRTGTPVENPTAPEFVEDAPPVAEPQSVADTPQQTTATEPPADFEANTPPPLGPDGETVVEPENSEAAAVPSQPTIAEIEAMPPEQLQTFKDTLELQSKAIGLNENQEPLLQKADELLAKNAETTRGDESFSETAVSEPVADREVVTEDPGFNADTPPPSWNDDAPPLDESYNPAPEEDVNDGPVVDTPFGNSTESNTTTDQELAAQLASQEEVQLEYEDGSLEVFEQESDENAEYREQNRIAEDFNQNEGQGESVKPLVAIKNFMSFLFQDDVSTPEIAAQVLQDAGVFASGALTDRQVDLFGDIKNFWLDVKDDIAINLDNKKAKILDDYRHRNYVSFLGDENGQYEENVIAAIAVAAYTYLAEDAGLYQSNDDSTIAGILGIDVEEVGPDERAQFKDVGARENLVQQALGKKVAQALGLKANKGAGKEAQTQLENSLGAHALAILQQKGLVQKHFVQSDLLQQSDDRGKGHPFIRFSAPEVLTMNPRAARANAIAKDTGSMLNKLFGVESSNVAPVTDKPGREFKQSKIKGTEQGVPKTLAKILGAVQQRPWNYKLDMMSLRSKFDDKLLGQIGGIPKDGTPVHEVNRVASESKSDSIMRDIVQVDEFFASVKDGIFYLIPKVWSPQRVGFENNAVNPQSSKVARHFIALDSHKVTFNPNASSDDHSRFLLAVAQGLGLDVDKVLNETSLEKLEKELAEPDVVAAIAALRRAKQSEDKMSTDDQLALVEATASREEFWTLEVLQAYVDYTDAQAAGTEFTTDVMFEVDGVTNGPALAHIQLGLGNRFAEATGFYTADDQFQSFTAWKSDKGTKRLDLYEIVASSVVKALKINSELRDAIYHFTGELEADGEVKKAGRKLVKQPLTSLVFGSGIKKAVDGMANSFVDSFYSKLSDSAAENGVAGINETIAQLNKLMPRTAQLSPVQSIEEGMALTLTQSQMNHAREIFKRTIGAGVESSLEENFQDFINTRTELNQAAHVGYQRYNTVYEMLREDLIQKLMWEDKLPWYNPPIPGKKGQKNTDIRKPDRDLTEAEEKIITDQLAGIAPIIHTAYSTRDGDLSAGINVTKTEQTLSKDRLYGSEVKFGQPVPDDARNPNTAKVKGKQPQGLRDVFSDPGVRAIIMAIHSTDSFIASQAYAKLKALNIHDALGLSLRDTIEGAQALNQSTFEAMVGYSVPLALADLVNRSFDNMTAALEGVDPELRAEIEKALVKLEVGNGENARAIDEDLRNELNNTARNIEIEKLEQLLEITSVDQYALEGGTYEVTEQDRKVIQAKLLKLQGSVETQPQAEVSASPEQEATIEPPKENVAPKSGTFGAAFSPGEPTSTINKYLTEALKSGKIKNVKQLVPVLKKAILNDDSLTAKHKKFQIQLLEQIALVDNGNLAIRYVTPEDEVDTNFGDDEFVGPIDYKTVSAWFNPNAGKPNITFLGDGFKNSHITVEVVMHELTHAVTSTITYDIGQADPSTLSADDLARYEATAELQRLRLKVVDFIANDPELKRKWSYAASNVRELIAFGMTNAEFQRDILAKIDVTNIAGDAKERVAKTGMAMFADKVMTILFGKKAISNDIRYGFGLMIANTAVIMGGNTGSQQGLDFHQTPEDTYTTQEIFDALGKLSSVSGKQAKILSGLLSEISSKVMGAYGTLAQEAYADAASNAEDVFLNALATGKKPFTSLASALLPITEQEAFVLEEIEVVMRGVFKNGDRTALNQLKMIRNDIKKAIPNAEALYEGDWSIASEQDKERAQEQYDLIFKPTGNLDGTSDYLSRFMAIALVYTPLRDAVNKVEIGSSQVVDDSGQNWYQRLKNMFSRAMQRVAYIRTKTVPGQSADTAIAQIAFGLAKIERKKRDRLASDRNDIATHLNTRLVGAAETARGAVGRLADRKILRNNRSKTVRGFAALTSVVANDRVNEFIATFEKLRDANFKDRLGVVGSVVNELKGENVANRKFHKLLGDANRLEQERKQRMIEISGSVQKSFGRELSQEESASLTRLVLRGDVAALIDNGVTLAELDSLLSDPAVMDAKIKELEDKLTGDTENFYIRQAKGLGYFLATGKVKADNQLLNADNIARLLGTGRKVNRQEAEADRVVIDQLASLYAIRYLGKEHSQRVVKVLREENQRQDGGNGIEFVIKAHSYLQKEALNSTFLGNEWNFQKGYTRDTYNPYISVKAATAEEGKQLEAAGYQRVSGPLSRDPADLDQTVRYMYVVRDGGLGETVQGIMTMFSKKAMGNTVHYGVNVPFSDGVVNPLNSRQNAKIGAQKKKLIDKQFTEDARSWEPQKDQSPNKLVPTLNQKGEADNYRYMMEEKTKDDVMERQNNVDGVLGKMAGALVEKERGPELNERAIDALHTDFLNDYAVNPNAFIRVDKNSTDPEVRDSWNRLPPETKQYIRETFGMNGMLVKKTNYDIAFGYRKSSIGDIFQKDPELQGALQRIAIHALGQVEIKSVDSNGKPVVERMGSKRALRLLQAEAGWQEVVKWVKDTWVIKNLWTLLGNEASNLTVLKLAGVPIATIAKDKIEAHQATNQYLKERMRRDELLFLLDSGNLDGSAAVAARQEIIELDNSLLTNPVSDLVDEGLFQTLIEDVGQENDPYSYQSRLARWADNKTKYISDPVKTAGSWFMMTHESPPYKILAAQTMLSDFTSRYVLYKHLTTRQDNPMSKDDAISRTRKAFVNYDVPTHKGLQYLNDMGFLWFTKYYFRIQAVLIELVREAPLRALEVLLMFEYIFDIPDILDSSMFTKWPGNLGSGALEAPGTLDDLLTWQIAEGLIPGD